MKTATAVFRPIKGHLRKHMFPLAALDSPNVTNVTNVAENCQMDIESDMALRTTIAVCEYLRAVQHNFIHHRFML